MDYNAQYQAYLNTAETALAQQAEWEPHYSVYWALI